MLDLLSITALFHGSHQIVREPNPFFSKTNRDFGQGFYTTPSKDDASNWARKTARRTNSGTPTVNRYDYFHNERLTVHYFDRTEKSLIKWIDFILFNRNELDLIGYDYVNRINHDIIVGPIADNRIAPVFELFAISQTRYREERGFRLSPNKFKARLIEDLDIERLEDQVCFKNLSSIRCLSFKESRQ